MAKKVDQLNTAVRLRLSPAQIAVLAPGIDLLFQSHQHRRRSGTSPLAYPFRIYPPPRVFDRGTYNQSFMDKILNLWETLRSKSPHGRWVKMDAIELRASIFAIRAYIKYVRYLRRQRRSEDREFKAKLRIDDRSIALLKAKSHRVIRSLERHMKRANRALINTVGQKRYRTLTIAWKAHLRWMRLHIAYCKPWAKPLSGRRARQQRDLNELMEMAKPGLRDAGYKPPEDKELRHLMRLYASYARSGRQGNWTIQFLLENKADFNRKYHLAQFVIDRSNLKELSKS